MTPLIHKAAVNDNELAEDNSQSSSQKSNSNTDTKIIDTTAEAQNHYFSGNGETARMGPNTQAALRNHPDVQHQLSALKSGSATVTNGNRGINMQNHVFHVGDTAVVFTTTCDSDQCTTEFTGFVNAIPGTNIIDGPDGFWDILGGGDRAGPKGELPGGTPYEYEPYEWTEEYPDKFNDDSTDTITSAE